jgi:hypothetical protein
MKYFLSFRSLHDLFIFKLIFIMICVGVFPVFHLRFICVAMDYLHKIYN